MPVLIDNNRKVDAEILKRFGEPAWNYQVVRFLNEKGEDVIPRKDQIRTTEALAVRMGEALEKKEKAVPAYLQGLISGSESF